MTALPCASGAAAGTAALALLLAWGWDALFGEPRDALHPVAWLGSLLGPAGSWLAARPAPVAFAGGALAWLVLAAAAGALACAWQLAAASWPPVVAAAAVALPLKPTFAWRMLHDEVAAVEAALLGDGVAAARSRLARLVSRDVAAMDADALRETAIETLAENLNDSVVAPLFWFALFGLPGAAVYRFANTADAMWGYRGRFEWAGKWAARADDALSWLPARLTALPAAAGGTGGLAGAAGRGPPHAVAERRLADGGDGAAARRAAAQAGDVRAQRPGAVAGCAADAARAAGRVARRLDRGRPRRGCSGLARMLTPPCATARSHGGADARGRARWDFSTNANAAGPCPIAVAALQAADAGALSRPRLSRAARAARRMARRGARADRSSPPARASSSSG